MSTDSNIRKSNANVWVFFMAMRITASNNHKALIQLFENPKCKIPLRIEGMPLRLQAYDFDLKFTKGELDISDYTIRHPVDQIAQRNKCEEYLNFVITHATPKAISIEEIKQETKCDRVMQNLI